MRLRYALLYLIVAFSVVLFLLLAFQTIDAGYIRLPDWVRPMARIGLW